MGELKTERETPLLARELELMNSSHAGWAMHISRGHCFPRPPCGYSLNPNPNPMLSQAHLDWEVIAVVFPQTPPPHTGETTAP